MAGRGGRTAAAGMLLALAALAGKPVEAQELNVTVGHSSSDYREFAEPLVLGAGIVIPAWRWLSVRLDYRRHDDSQVWDTSTCQGLIPPDDPSCELDTFDGDFTYQAVGLGPQITVPVGGRVRAFASVLLSRVWLDGVWEGRGTGSRLGRAPDETSNAWTILGGGLVRITDHVDATIAARRITTDFTLCIQDTYYPFCDGTPLRTVEFGLSLRR